MIKRKRKKKKDRGNRGLAFEKETRVPLNQLEARLWRWFSEYVRRSGANDFGMVYCYTCNRYLYWNESQAGHFVPRGRKAVKFNEQNVKPQCPRCNHPLWGKGESGKFAIRLDKDYGRGTAERLQSLGSIRGAKLGRVWIVQKIGEYKEKVHELRRSMKHIDEAHKPVRRPTRMKAQSSRFISEIDQRDVL